MSRIAIFSIAYDPFIGGAEIAIKQITNRLPQYSYDLYTALFDATLPKQETIGNVRVFRIGTGNRFFDKLFFAFRARTLFKQQHAKNPYHVVHAIMANYAGLAALLIKKQFPHIPYILTLQSGDSNLFIWARTWFWYPWYKQIYTKADYIIAISSWLAKRAKSYGYKKHIQIIPNGVDTALFGKPISAEQKSTIRASWGVDDLQTVVISTSRLVHKNGLDILIQSLSYTETPIRLVLVGSGKDEYALRAQAKKYGNKVLFIGTVEHSQLPVLLQSADIFCRPSRSEGLGISFLEAMAAGVPVVAPLVGGIVDFLIDTKTGIVIKEHDPRQVAESIRRVVGNADLRTKIIAEAKAMIMKTYEWDTVARAYNAVYSTAETYVPNK